MGVERIIEILKFNDNFKVKKNISIGIINDSSENEVYAHSISKDLRYEFSGISFYNTDSSASLTSQLKNAIKINDKFVIVITDDNIKNKNLTIKISENQMTDTLISLEDLIKYMRNKYE